MQRPLKWATGEEPEWFRARYTYHVIEFKKGHQDRTLSYKLYTQDQQALDNLRVGQKVSLRLGLLSVSQSRLVDGYILSIEPETKMPACDNGHEYAPSSGYKFCPLDGLPLKEQ